MNKKINLIIGSGVLGAYLSADLIKKKEIHGITKCILTRGVKVNGLEFFQTKFMSYIKRIFNFIRLYNFTHFPFSY